MTPPPKKVAIVLDGGFVKKKLQTKLGKHPVASDVVQLAMGIMKKPKLSNAELFRIYYYDAMPYERTEMHPISRKQVNFSTTPQAQTNRSLIDQLELQDDFAVRKGTVIFSGWKLNGKSLEQILETSRAVQEADVVPNITQKGVDIRIGLDIGGCPVDC